MADGQSRLSLIYLVKLTDWLSGPFHTLEAARSHSLPQKPVESKTGVENKQVLFKD